MARSSLSTRRLRWFSRRTSFLTQLGRPSISRPSTWTETARSPSPILPSNRSQRPIRRGLAKHEPVRRLCALVWRIPRPDGGHRSLALPLNDIAALVEDRHAGADDGARLLRALFGARDDGLSGSRVHAGSP